MKLPLCHSPRHDPISLQYPLCTARKLLGDYLEWEEKSHTLEGIANGSTVRDALHQQTLPKSPPVIKSPPPPITPVQRRGRQARMKPLDISRSGLLGSYSQDSPYASPRAMPVPEVPALACPSSHVTSFPGHL